MKNLFKSHNNIQGEEQVVNKNRRRQPMRNILPVLLAIILIFLGVLAYKYLFGRTYDSYSVVNTTDITDYTSIEYKEYMDNLIKYTKDGITYINKKGESIWSESFDMKMPEAVVSGEYVAVADLNGKDVYIFDSKGKVSDIKMTQTICDVDVASQGVFVVILEDTDKNYINLYDKNGEIITEMQTTIDKSGYPLDVTLSEDGKKLFTSYVYVDGVEVKNGLAAYNFGSVGQNENSDRLMGGYKFADTIIPKVEFLDNNTVCAFGDNQFIIYSMKEKPSEKATVKFDHEIKSIFYNSDYVGVVYANDEAKASEQYTLEVFNTNGKTVLKKNFDIAYNKIHLIDNEIVVIGDSDCNIYTLKGRLKFSYSFEDKVIDIIPSNNNNEYIVLHEDRLDTIKLKHSKNK